MTWRIRESSVRSRRLVVTQEDEPAITADNIKVMQFVYLLLLHNEKIRDVIDTITSKAMLVLGRFTPERKAVLDAMREELQHLNYVPILFDLAKPASKDLTGAVQTLANMARFIIADLTDPSCVPHELAMLVPRTVVPVKPVLLEGQHEYAMFIDLTRRYGWVLDPYSYASSKQLIADLVERVIRPAEIKALELRGGAGVAACSRNTRLRGRWAYYRSGLGYLESCCVAHGPSGKLALRRQSSRLPRPDL